MRQRWFKLQHRRPADGSITTDVKTVQEMVDLVKKGGGKWEDHEFGPDVTSVTGAISLDGKDSRCEVLRGLVCGWKRATGLSQQAQLFVQGASCGDVQQGLLDDCWLLGAAASLATRGALVKSLFEVALVDKGFYVVRLWMHASWHYVMVDDWLPVDARGTLAFGRCTNPNEFWLPILEKAMAKLLTDLTGEVALSLKLNVHPVEELWQNLLLFRRDGDLLLCFAASEARAYHGILKKHAYAVVDVMEVDPNKLRRGVGLANQVNGKVRLIRIRDPWGACSHAVMDTEDPVAFRSTACGSVGSDAHASSLPQRNQVGTFWIPFHAFLKVFSDITVCRLLASSGWHRHTTMRKWRPSFSGHERARSPEYWRNPQIALTVHHEGLVYVGINVPDQRVWKGERSRVATKLDVYAVKSNRIKMTQDTQADQVCRTPYRRSRDHVRELHLTPGQYILIPTLKEKRSMVFWLSAWSERSIEFHPVGKVKRSYLCDSHVSKHSYQGCLPHYSDSVTSVDDSLQQYPVFTPKSVERAEVIACKATMEEEEAPPPASHACNASPSSSQRPLHPCDDAEPLPTGSWEDVGSLSSTEVDNVNALRPLFRAVAGIVGIVGTALSSFVTHDDFVDEEDDDEATEGSSADETPAEASSGRVPTPPPDTNWVAMESTIRSFEPAAGDSPQQELDVDACEDHRDDEDDGASDEKVDFHEMSAFLSQNVVQDLSMESPHMHPTSVDCTTVVANQGSGAVSLMTSFCSHASFDDQDHQLMSDADALLPTTCVPVARWGMDLASDSSLTDSSSASPCSALLDAYDSDEVAEGKQDEVPFEDPHDGYDSSDVAFADSDSESSVVEDAPGSRHPLPTRVTTYASWPPWTPAHVDTHPTDPSLVISPDPIGDSHGRQSSPQLRRLLLKITQLLRRSAGRRQCMSSSHRKDSVSVSASADSEMDQSWTISLAYNVLLHDKDVRGRILARAKGMGLEAQFMQTDRCWKLVVYGPSPSQSLRSSLSSSR